MQGAVAHQPVVGVVVDRLQPHRFLESIEAMCCGALEECVGAAAASDTEDYLLAFAVLAHHVGHRPGVVLKVGIYRDAGVAVIHRRHKSGKECILMPAVMRQGYAFHAFVGKVHPLNRAPCGILAAVVAAQYVAVGVNFALGSELVEESEHGWERYWQYFFFVVARHYDCNEWRWQ